MLAFWKQIANVHVVDAPGRRLLEMHLQITWHRQILSAVKLLKHLERNLIPAMYSA